LNIVANIKNPLILSGFYKTIIKITILIINY